MKKNFYLLFIYLFLKNPSVPNIMFDVRKLPTKIRWKSESDLTTTREYQVLRSDDFCVLQNLSRSVINTNNTPAITHARADTQRKRNEVRVGDRRGGEWAGQRRYSQQHRRRPQSLWPSRHLHQNWSVAFTHHFYIAFGFTAVTFIFVEIMFGNEAS